MTTRRIVTAVVLVFIGFFAFLTFYDIVRNGIDVLALVSLVVLLLFAVGIVGALSQPPEE